MTTQELVAALLRFAEQRPGMNTADYGSYSDYQSEARKVRADLIVAQRLALDVLQSGVTPEGLLAALPSRLSIKDGEVQYCTGQYFPTEYRAAVCRAFATALWDHERAGIRENYSPIGKGDILRGLFLKRYGRKLAQRFFD